MPSLTVMEMRTHEAIQSISHLLQNNPPMSERKKVAMHFFPVFMEKYDDTKKASEAAFKAADDFLAAA